MQITQLKAATVAGVGLRTWQRWELGEYGRPDLGHLQRLENAFPGAFEALRTDSPESAEPGSEGAA